jgi:hypothetical protein
MYFSAEMKKSKLDQFIPSLIKKIATANYSILQNQPAIYLSPLRIWFLLVPNY